MVGEIEESLRHSESGDLPLYIYTKLWTCQAAVHTSTLGTAPTDTDNMKFPSYPTTNDHAPPLPIQQLSTAGISLPSPTPSAKLMRAASDHRFTTY